MKKSSLRVLLQRGGDITIRGLPQALERAQGETIRKELPGARNLGAWQAIGWKAREAVLSILDVDLMQVLVEAWGKYQTLADFAAEPKRSRGTHLVSIADHTMSVAFHPTVEVTVEGLGRGTLTFDLEVKATVKAITLSVTGGRITSVSSGSCNGAVTLKLDQAVLVEQSFPEVELPGVLSLGDGIPIPHAEAAAPEPERQRLPTH